jgi:hypothetical protein
VREGWNIGKPPYGYAAKRYRHPNPMKAERAATKTRLEPDGAKGQAVTQIAHWRYYENLGYSTIVDRRHAVRSARGGPGSAVMSSAQFAPQAGVTHGRPVRAVLRLANAPPWSFLSS